MSHQAVIELHSFNSTMKLSVLITSALAFVNVFKDNKVFKDSPVTGEAWLQYTRSGFRNKALSQRIPEHRLVTLQRVQNEKVKQLRAAIAELLIGNAAMKSKRRKPKQNKQKNRFNRFKNCHN